MDNPLETKSATATPTPSIATTAKKTAQENASPAPQSTPTPQPAPTPDPPSFVPSRPLYPADGTLVVNGATFEFLPVSSGAFVMGSPEDEMDRSDNETLTPVRITHPFWLLKTELSQKQWKAVMGKEPPPNPDKQFPGFLGPELPVESVSWGESVNFCRALQKTEAYREKFKDMIATLPTEAQWEYACRAGKSTPFSIGDGHILTTTLANFDGTYPYCASPVGDYRRKTTPVGSFKTAVNPWGFSDMHGNVWEWCWDVYHPQPRGGDDPGETDPPEPGTVSRVYRGGSWFFAAKGCRSANREQYPPSKQYYALGFRVAIVPAGTRGK